MRQVFDRWPGSRCAAIGAVVLGIAVFATACSSKPKLGEVEEEQRSATKVPPVVHDTANTVAAQLGEGHCDRWFWDYEDQDWECEFNGLSRAAELDVRSDGQFMELELVYDLDEVEKILPEEAALIRKHCRDAPGVLIELSLRRQVLLDDLPELAEAWTMSGVVLEYQCPNGNDYEVDARHKSVMKRVDDKQDLSSHKKGGN